MFKYKFMYTDNDGNDGTWGFVKETDAAKKIDKIMQDKYDELCKKYPDRDVRWLNRLLNCGNTTEIYVPDTEEYAEIKMMWPSQKRELDTDKAAEQFMGWLVRENFFCYDDDYMKETYKEIKEDFRATYEIAPRLINLLFDISDV